MNFLRFDSPIMRGIATIADMIIVHILFLICSIPVITIGASLSAKYYVEMKIIKGEDTGVIMPFFKAFKNNFKPATICWGVLLVAYFLIYLDWKWIIDNGWNSTAFIYKLGIIVVTVLVWLLTLTIFPLISRYEMKITEYFRGGLTLGLIRLIPLALVTALGVAAIFACIWYLRWFPLIYLASILILAYLFDIIFIKQFNKLEAAQKDDEVKKDESSEEAILSDTVVEEDRDTEEEVASEVASVTPEGTSSSDDSYARSVRDLHREIDKENDLPAKEPEPEITGNKLTKYIKTEKRKLKDLNGKQKAVYFAQYYLPTIVIVLVAIVGIVWFIHDTIAEQKLILSGGLINCGELSDDGRTYATTDFLKWSGYDNKEAELAETELSYGDDFEYQDKHLEVILRAQIAMGTFNYVIINENALDNYCTIDNFQDIGMYMDISKVSEEDLYKTPDSEDEDAEMIPVAVKLPERTVQKLGFDPEGTYYISFAYNANNMEANSKLLEYLFL